MSENIQSEISCDLVVFCIYACVFVNGLFMKYVVYRLKEIYWFYCVLYEFRARDSSIKLTCILCT